MRRPWLSMAVATAALLITAAPTLACGGLIGPNGAVNLLRTTTFAGYHDGIEHYVTSFEFAGGGGAFGSITPLPGIPTDVIRGGDWTLQRLIRETDPPPDSLFEAASAGGGEAREAEVLLETTIDALDITILRGGGDEVGLWAKNHGFRLPPDAPEVLDFYADRSPIFMAAAFDADAAAERGQAIGDGTPVHLVIPTDNPWVPLRILGLGKADAEIVEADVYLLTDIRPALLPKAGAFAESDGLHPRPQRARHRPAVVRPALGRGHGVGSRRGLADEGRGGGRGWLARLRPRDRRVGRRLPFAGGRRLRAVHGKPGTTGTGRRVPPDGGHRGDCRPARHRTIDAARLAASAARGRMRHRAVSGIRRPWPCSSQRSRSPAAVRRRRW